LADPHDPANVVCPRCKNALDVSSTESVPDFAEIGAATSPDGFDAGDFDARRGLRSSPDGDEYPEWDWDFEFSSFDPWLDDSPSRQQPAAAATTRRAPSDDSGPNAGQRFVLPPAPQMRILSTAPALASQSNWIAWLVISSGVMLFMCGGVLLGWSFFSEQALLWRVGLPATLFGQALLIAGLVLQLESLWHVHRQTSQSLRKLGGELKQLEHATTMLASTHSTAAQSFYVHLAERASPHLLLADLKGQLDVLAMRLAQQTEEEAA
jgi:hypothetical protein